ncbi:MAG: RNase adapter RapZ [Formosimonas sp.]
MNIVLITGLSGSGKSVALNLLEDAGYYCVDNLPANLLPNLVSTLSVQAQQTVAVSIDARSSTDLSKLPSQIDAFRQQGFDVHCLFLTANDTTLIQRFSETRRRHPLSREVGENSDLSLLDSIALERERLLPLLGISAVLDTSTIKARQLQHWIKDLLALKNTGLTVLFESFGFKHGIPTDADLVFDVRCLPNPFYDASLRPLTGLDAPVQDFLKQQADTHMMIEDIEQFVTRWLPRFEADNRSYLTVAIGCTGGQHRSVYIAQALAQRMVSSGQRRQEQVLVRHRTLT